MALDIASELSEIKKSIANLIKAKKLPDGHYGDDECHLWSVIYNTLELHSK